MYALKPEVFVSELHTMQALNQTRYEAEAVMLQESTPVMAAQSLLV